jgi:hypothetical protein
MKLTSLDKLFAIFEEHLPNTEEMHQSFCHNSWKYVKYYLKGLGIDGRVIIKWIL